MNTTYQKMGLAIAAFHILSAIGFAQAEETTSKEPKPPVKTMIVTDQATLEAKLTGVLEFESIAGTLKIPGAKVTQMENQGGEMRLSFSDGSSITGKLLNPLQCETFLGPIQVQAADLKFFGPRTAPAEADEKPQKKITYLKPDPDEVFSYIVMEGDTMESIARTFITTVGRLKVTNPKLTGNNLKPGVEIKIPPLD